MPFTLCHPALMLPLYRKAPGATSLAALVIGSMAPDFVYFFSFGVSGAFSHSALGALVYCVPAGALVYGIYYALLRPAMLCWLPQAVSARMTPPVVGPMPTWRGAAMVLGSLLLGAASHIGWDAFTHDNAGSTTLGTLLRTTVSAGTFHLPLFKVLQHMSSLVGFLVIARYTFLWYASTEPTQALSELFSKRQRLAIGALIVAAGLSGGGLGVLRHHTNSLEHAMFVLVVHGMAASALAMLTLCIAWKMRLAQR